MKPAVKKIITGIIPIGEEYLDVFFSAFKPVSYRKGDYFVREGQVGRYIGFITKGCMRCIYKMYGKGLIR